MLACTAFSVASDGTPAVMAPSKNRPAEPLEPSPPVPRMIDPSLCIGEYPLGGSDPLNQVVRQPPVASPPLSAKNVWPSFFCVAVTNGVWLPRLLAGVSPLVVWKRPF